MICPHCGAEKTAVIETRRGAFNTTIRRRECENGHRFGTREIHEPVFCSAKQRAKAFAATVASRIRLRLRDIEIARQSHIGWQALVQKHGLERSTVFLAARRGRAIIKSEAANQRGVQR